MPEVLAMTLALTVAVAVILAPVVKLLPLALPCSCRPGGMAVAADVNVDGGTTKRGQRDFVDYFMVKLK